MGEEYGVGGRNCARYVRINTLNADLKALLDAGRITFVAAVDISYLTAEEQDMLAEIMRDKTLKIRGSVGQELRAQSGSLNRETMTEMVMSTMLRKNASDACWFRQVKKKYFDGVESEEMRKIIEAALDSYFKKEADVVQRR